MKKIPKISILIFSLILILCLANTAHAYDTTDFTKLATDWLKSVTSSPADVNLDKKVNSRDLGIMMSKWGSSTPTLTPTPTENITVRARGNQGGETIDLQVNGNTINTWTLTTEYLDYTATAAISSSDDVKVYFTNDDGGNMDVQIDYAIINGTQYEAENQATNTGAWNNNTGTCGGAQSEWLHCDGYIQFQGNAPAPAPEPTQAPTPTPTPEPTPTPTPAPTPEPTPTPTPYTPETPTMQTYSTNFNLAEDRISEGEKWINGAATGIDWTNVKTSNGNATGTQVRDTNQYYDDSVAVLKGNWGPDQTVEATVYSANQNNGGASGFGGNGSSVDPNCNKEVELILRGDITANNITLYEVNFSSRIDGTAYAEIGKWGGARGYFPYGYLSRKVDNTSENCDAAGGCGVANGDVVRATIIGNTINVYKNGVLINSFTDTYQPFATGKPGIGFYSSAGCTGTAHNDDFGFTSFTATDAP